MPINLSEKIIIFDGVIYQKNNYKINFLYEKYIHFDLNIIKIVIKFKSESELKKKIVINYSDINMNMRKSKLIYNIINIIENNDKKIYYTKRYDKILNIKTYNRRFGFFSTFYKWKKESNIKFSELKEYIGY